MKKDTFFTVVGILATLFIFAYTPISCYQEAHIPEEPAEPTFPPLLQTTPAPIRVPEWPEIVDVGTSKVIAEEAQDVTTVILEANPYEDEPMETSEISPEGPVETLDPVPTLAPAPSLSATPDSIPDQAEIQIEEEPLPSVTPSAEVVLNSKATAFAYSEEIPLSEDLQKALWMYCNENNIPYEIGIGLIETESSFRSNADSGSSYGLCQLNRLYFPANLAPWENIREGMRYLGDLYSYYGDMPAALTAYNVGHDNGSRNYANVVYGYAEKWADILASVQHP